MCSNINHYSTLFQLDSALIKAPPKAKREILAVYSQDSDLRVDLSVPHLPIDMRCLNQTGNAELYQAL